MLNKNKFNISHDIKTYKLKLSEFIKKDSKDFLPILNDVIFNLCQIKYFGSQIMEIVIRECIKNNTHINIDEMFIRHCFCTINGKQINVRNRKSKDGTIKKKSNEIIKEIYDKYKHNFNDITVNYDAYLTDSLKNDIDQILVCMQTHVSMNFLKIQKYNIGISINYTFESYKFVNNNFATLKRLIFIQIYNEEYKNTTFFDDVKLDLQLNKLIKDLKKEIPLNIFDILRTNCTKKNFSKITEMKSLTDSKNLFHCYTYFHTILKKIDQYNMNIKDKYKKIGGFTLIPRLKMNVNHVAIGLETMRILIRKYYKKKKLVFNDKKYTDNHHEYYYKFFNIEKYHKLGYFISLFHTDGYSVSLTLMRKNEFDVLKGIDKDISLIIKNNKINIDLLKTYNDNKQKVYEHIIDQTDDEKKFMDISESINYIDSIINLHEDDEKKIENNIKKFNKYYDNIDYIKCNAKYKKIVKKIKDAQKLKKKKNKKKIIEKTCISLKTEKGLYNADYTNMNKKDLNKCTLIKIDPGNNKMFNMLVNNKTFTMKKNHYFNLAGILNDNMLRKRILDNNEEIKCIYTMLSKTNLKTAKIDKILKYINIMTQHWETLWTYYKNRTFNKLKYKKYIMSKQAISRITKEIIKKYKKKKKKLLFLMGNGNGTMTITNTKNSSSVGPIKRIIKELSMREVVVYVDEYKTSKLCNCCEEEIEHVYCLHYSSNKSIKNNPSKEMSDDIQNYDNKELTKLHNKINSSSSTKKKIEVILKTHKEEDKKKVEFIRNLIDKEKDQLKKEALKKINKNKEEIKGIDLESKKKEKKKEIKTYRYVKGKRREEMLNHWSYSLVRCNNEACKGYAKLTNRDTNASNAIGYVGCNKLLNLDLGNYTREKKDSISAFYENN